MGSGVGGCVNVPGTCALKMMLRYRTSWNLRHVTMGSGVGGCVNDPVTCVLKMMLSYRTSWNLRHVTMGSGVGGCVNVPGTCVLKMMLRYRTLSGKSVTPATPNEFFAALKRLLKAT